MKIIDMDGSAWNSVADFYDVILPALGAPKWHGRNLDALNDSISGNDINEVRLPYTIRIRGAANMNATARAMVERFRELILEL
ncbi:MAG TPA: barstar family protein, partial [Candidatus Cybelea sp.]|nr:barstar family protein [Candidatus Cybelea sp.]